MNGRLRPPLRQSSATSSRIRIPPLEMTELARRRCTGRDGGTRTRDPLCSLSDQPPVEIMASDDLGVRLSSVELATRHGAARYARQAMALVRLEAIQAAKTKSDDWETQHVWPISPGSSVESLADRSRSSCWTVSGTRIR